MMFADPYGDVERGGAAAAAAGRAPSPAAASRAPQRTDSAATVGRPAALIAVIYPTISPLGRRSRSPRRLSAEI